MIKQYLYKILYFIKLKNKKRKSPYSFIDIGYNWADSFKDLIFCEDINMRIQKLKHGLDMESCSIIDEVLEKLICLIPRSTQKALFDKNTLFSQRDLALQKEILDNKMWSEYPLSDYFMSEVYYYHNGIKLLPTHYIASRIHNKTIIDVGAANGDSAFCFAKYNPYRIVSFEMEALCFNELNENIKKYNINAFAFNLAVSNCNTEQSVRLDSMLNANNGGGGGNIPKITTESSLHNSHLEIGLIKMDIEGAEIKALLGAKETIYLHRPILIIAIYHNAEQFFDTKELIDSWDLGYSFFIAKLSVFHPTDEVMLFCLPKID